VHRPRASALCIQEDEAAQDQSQRWVQALGYNLNGSKVFENTCCAANERSWSMKVQVKG